MTPMDVTRYAAAYDDLRDCYGQKVTPEHIAQRDAWWRKLAAFDIDTVVAAFEAAPRYSKRYFPNIGNILEAIDGVQADKGGVRDTTSRTRYYRDEQGVTQAEYACWTCCDTGYRAKVIATGEVVTEAELQQRCNLPKDDPRYLSSADYRMARCGCRVQARQGAA